MDSVRVAEHREHLKVLVPAAVQVAALVTDPEFHRWLQEPPPPQSPLFSVQAHSPEVGIVRSPVWFHLLSQLLSALPPFMRQKITLG